MIYTITMLRSGESPYKPRCVGYFLTFQAAENNVLVNRGDMFECGYYNYAIIEEVCEGIYPISCIDHRWFYKFVFSYEGEDAITPCSDPEFAKAIYCFSIG